MSSVKLNKMIEKLQLVNLVPEVSTDEIEISSPEINRPALQLAGYFEHFASERVQIIGYVEYTYLKSLDRDVKLANYEQFLSSDIPCVIYSTRTEPDEDMIKVAIASVEAVFDWKAYLKETFGYEVDDSWMQDTTAAEEP